MALSSSQAPLLDGLLIIDKPVGFTSFDVVAKVRGMLKTRKVGHAGTLDPMATGVLPVFVGRGTKCCNLLPNQDKRYTAAFRLGTVTDTLDITGTVLQENTVNVTMDQVQQAIEQFTGDIMQVPPMYSAIQIGGKRLYDLARQGIEVERPARPVTIYHCRLVQGNQGAGEYVIDVACSKGTYIRTLCHDIGQALGCGAVMTSLRRTEAAGFTEGEAISLEEADRLAAARELPGRILPVERVFASLPTLKLNQRQCFLYCNGVPLELSRISGAEAMEGDVRVLDVQGRFLGVSTADRAQGQLKLRQLFALEQ